MDMTTLEKIRERLKNLDIHSLLTSLISGIGSMTTEDFVSLLYVLIFCISSWVGISHTLTKNRFEKANLDLDLDLKREDLRAKRLLNDKQSCETQTVEGKQNGNCEN